MRLLTWARYRTATAIIRDTLGDLDVSPLNAAEKW